MSLPISGQSPQRINPPKPSSVNQATSDSAAASKTHKPTPTAADKLSVGGAGQVDPKVVTNLNANQGIIHNPVTASKGLSNANARYNDASAGAQIDKLKSLPGPISGKQMRDAIHMGTKDLDANAASGEFNDFDNFAKAKPDKLSAEAKGAMRVYSGYAKQAQDAGQTGIKLDQYEQMKTDMAKVKYHDESAGQAIEKLKSQTGAVSGEQMREAIINGTQDLDGQATTGEFQDIKNFARDSWSQLSPEAQQQYGVYEKYANKYQKTGMPLSEFNKMKDEMAALGQNSQGEISGDVSGQKSNKSAETAALAQSEGTVTASEQGIPTGFSSADLAAMDQDKQYDTIKVMRESAGADVSGMDSGQAAGSLRLQEPIPGDPQNSIERSYVAWMDDNGNKCVRSFDNAEQAETWAAQFDPKRGRIRQPLFSVAHDRTTPGILRGIIRQPLSSFSSNSWAKYAK